MTYQPKSVSIKQLDGKLNKISKRISQYTDEISYFEHLKSDVSARLANTKYFLWEYDSQIGRRRRFIDLNSGFEDTTKRIKQWFESENELGSMPSIFEFRFRFAETHDISSYFKRYTNNLLNNNVIGRPFVQDWSRSNVLTGCFERYLTDEYGIETRWFAPFDFNGHYRGWRDSIAFCPSMKRESNANSRVFIYMGITNSGLMKGTLSSASFPFQGMHFPYSRK